jgi:polysaccharide pyruvyl transferase CsaB
VRFIILGYYGHQNTGDEAMLEVIVSRLRYFYPNCIIWIYSADPDGTEKRLREYGVQVPEGLRNMGKVTLHRELKLLSAITKSDILLFGGGTFLQDYGVLWKSLAVRFARALVAKLTRTKLVLIGAGAANINTPLGKFFSALTVRLSDIAIFRDQESISLLSSFGVPKSKMKLSADLTFLLDDLVMSEERQPIKSDERIKIGVSILPFYEDIQIDSARYETFVAELAGNLDMILDEFNTEMYFLAMKDGRKANDNKFAQFVSSKMSHCQEVTVIDYKEDFRETFALIKMMDICIGMRLHSLIFAFLAGVPSIGISYNTKVESFMRAIDMDQWCIKNPMDVKHRKLFTKFRQMINEGAYYPDRRQQIREFRDLAEKNFEYLDIVVRGKA